MLFMCAFRLQQLDTKVCGTDGVTYKNECELKMASCKQQTFIERASKGDCGEYRSSIVASTTLEKQLGIK